MDLIDRHQIVDLLYFKPENRIMGRPIFEPVYRNPSGTADEDNEYVWPNGFKGGAVFFSPRPSNKISKGFLSVRITEKPTAVCLFELLIRAR
jgi:hypothetical protein